MPGADPNPIVSHLEDDAHHLTRKDLDAAISALRTELMAAIDAVAPPKGPKK